MQGTLWKFIFASFSKRLTPTVQHQLAVIRTLQHRGPEVRTSDEGRRTEEHVHHVFRTCGYPSGAKKKEGQKNSQKGRMQSIFPFLVCQTNAKGFSNPTSRSTSNLFIISDKNWFITRTQFPSTHRLMS